MISVTGGAVSVGPGDGLGVTPGLGLDAGEGDGLGEGDGDADEPLLPSPPPVSGPGTIGSPNGAVEP